MRQHGAHKWKVHRLTAPLPERDKILVKSELDEKLVIRDEPNNWPKIRTKYKFCHELNMHSVNALKLRTSANFEH